MEEIKRSRTPKVTTEATPSFKPVRFVQMHDAFTPLMLAPIMSLSKEGGKAMVKLEERGHGIFVEHPTGRTFLVPYGNISFYEYEVEA